MVMPPGGKPVPVHPAGPCSVVMSCPQATHGGQNSMTLAVHVGSGYGGGCLRSGTCGGHAHGTEQGGQGDGGGDDLRAHDAFLPVTDSTVRVTPVAVELKGGTVT
jgi:hypothetical protein